MSPERWNHEALPALVGWSAAKPGTKSCARTRELPLAAEDLTPRLCVGPHLVGETTCCTLRRRMASQPERSNGLCNESKDKLKALLKALGAPNADRVAEAAARLENALLGSFSGAGASENITTAAGCWSGDAPCPSARCTIEHTRPMG